MRSCSSALCVLILLITTFTTESESCFNSLKVKLHDSATLSCTGTCQVARWSLLSNFNETLAECDQTSCRSVKEGYQMIHHEYLRGNLSLIIARADLSMTTSYLCKCDKQNICYVTLQSEPFSTTLQIDSGETLMLITEISDPVAVIYNSTHASGPSSGQICEVNGSSLQCKPGYAKRAHLTSVLPFVLELREMSPSDSGTYSIVDKKNDKVLHIYTVTVKELNGDRSDLDTDRGAAVPVWVAVLLMVVLVVLVAVIVVLVVMIVQLRKEIQQLWTKNEGNGTELNGLSSHRPVNERLPLQNNDQELRERITDQSN